MGRVFYTPRANALTFPSEVLKSLLTSKKMKFSLVIVGILCIWTRTSIALECYSYEDQENDSFINDPRAAQIETCVSNRQCFYWREEISTSSSSSVSTKRGCGEFVSVQDDFFGGDISVVSYTCSKDLCNYGPVKQNLSSAVSEFLIEISQNVPNFLATPLQASVNSANYFGSCFGNHFPNMLTNYRSYLSTIKDLCNNGPTKQDFRPAVSEFLNKIYQYVPDFVVTPLQASVNLATYFGSYFENYFPNILTNYRSYISYPTWVRIPDSAELLAPFYNLISKYLNNN